MSTEPPAGRPFQISGNIGSKLRFFIRDLADCAICTTDPQGLVTSCNAAAEELVGLAEAEMLGGHVSRLFTDTDFHADGTEAALAAALRDGIHALRYWRLTKDGGRRGERLSLRPIFDDERTHLGFGGIIHPGRGQPAAATRAAEPLQWLGEHSPAIRSLVAERLHDADPGSPFTLLCLCVSEIDETAGLYGLPVADALLAFVVETAAEAAEGAFVGRYGNACLFFLGGEPETAEPFALSLRAAAERDIEILGHLLRPRVAIGMARYPLDGTGADELIESVQAAAYFAKADRERTPRFFEGGMAARLRERRLMASGLRRAVARSELFLLYQPTCRVDGTITGFEALLRWARPNHGLTMPAEFLPVAEEIDLMMELGAWVLTEACREAASWLAPLKIAVNLSPSQLQSPAFPDLVEAVLAETRLPADRLELEITESALLGDFQRAFASLRRIKALGVSIAMDDFGTGYSSLSNIRAFPFDRIKIERSFTADVDSDPRAASIVRATIALAHSIGVPITAEGVETDAQRQFLAREGCEEMQGYAIGMPLPIAAYAAATGEPS
jgi:PAS domain S-box-containing protein